MVGLFLLPLTSRAQDNRVLLLKNKGVVIRSYTRGDYIKLQFSNLQWITGYIDWIKKDSVQINQFVLQGGTGFYGTYSEDTLRLGRLQVQVNEIIAFPFDKGHYNSVITNGSFLKAGGILYIGLNVINSLLNKDPVFEKENVPKLIGGGLVYVAGKIIRKNKPNYRPIGKRYSLEIL